VVLLVALVVGGGTSPARAATATPPRDCLRTQSLRLDPAATAIPVAAAGGPATAAESRAAAAADADLTPDPAAKDRVSLETRRLGPGAWSYFGDPRAVAYGPWVYTGWISEAGRVKIARYKPGLGGPVQTVTIGHTGTDDHNNPSLMVTAKGRIVAFYSPHSGRYHPRGGPGKMFYRFTVKPGAISQWTKPKALPVNAPGDLGVTYPNPIAISPEKTFLAWRGGCWKPTFALREGTTWGPAREIVQGPEGQRPYAKYAAGLPGSGVVHMCYTESHPKQFKTGVHCLEYKDRRFSLPDGTRVAGLPDLPIPAAKGSEVYAYDKKLGRAWVMDVRDDGQGRPVVIFSVGYYRSVQRFMYARWTGDRWQVSEVAPAFSDDRQRRTAGLFETGGMAFDPQDPNVLFLGRVINHRAKVERWQTADGGLTWSRTQRISPIAGNCFRPTAVASKGRTVVLFVCGDLKSWTSFDTSIQAVTLGPRGSGAPGVTTPAAATPPAPAAP
jgi:hypothetical protein